MSSASYSHVLKYTWLFGGVQGLGLLVGILRNKAVALFLGPSGLALMNIYNTAANLLNQSTNLGISFSAIKDIASQQATGDIEAVRQSVQSVRIWSVMAAFLGVVFTLIASPVLSYFTFGNYHYTPAFASLSLMVGMMTITGGELAILKGLKCLKRVAVVSVLCGVLSLIVYVPIYGLWGMSGIIPALLLSTFGILLIHLYYSHKVMPWQLRGINRTTLKYGIPFVKLGLAFIVAGVFGQGAEYVMRALLLRVGGMDIVGFYNCGFIMVVSYASLVFTAVENDYFPRLSSVIHNRHAMIDTVNKQIEVCVLLVAPVLVVFVLFIPIAVPLLFSSAFSHAVGMSTCAVFYIFFKALTLPAGYLPLAAGHSKVYMSMEIVYDILLALSVPLSYHLGGLQGIGWGLSVMGLIDLFMVHIVYRIKYGYVFRSTSPWVLFTQFVLLCTTVYAALCLPLMHRCIVGAVTIPLSIVLSVRLFNRETQLWNKIKGFFKIKTN